MRSTEGREGIRENRTPNLVTTTPIEDWVEELREHSLSSIKLLMQNDKNKVVKQLESDAGIEHLAMELSMVVVTLNRWIARHAYHKK